MKILNLIHGGLFMSDKSFKVNVKRLAWITTPQGFVKPLAVLDKEFKKSGIEFDSVGLKNAVTVEKMGINAGACLRIKVDKKNKALSILGNLEHVKVSLPKECPACNSRLVAYKEVDLYCPNDICGAKERTPLVKLLSRCLDTSEFEILEVYNYLNSFVVSDAENPVCAKSILDFLQMWEQAGHKNTNFRDELLKKAHPESYEEFKKIETKIDEKLSSGISSSDMWYISTLKGVKQADIELLSRVNMTLTANKSFQDQVTELDIDKDLKITVALNESYLKTLYNSFNTLRKK